MNIALLHYHLQPGGVTSVIREQALALHGHGNVMVISGSAPPAGFPAPVEVVPDLGYDRADAPHPQPEKTAAQVLSAISRHWPGGCDVLHVHNPTLAKNRRFLDILAGLQEAGARLLLQIHDFAENGRPEAYFRQPYPADCHYAVINRRDQAMLLRCGLRPEGLHWIPNIVRPLPPAGDASPMPPRILYPVRAIRRKNIGEAILLSLLTPQSSGLAVTLPPNSAIDGRSHEDWKRFVRRHDLPVVFDAGLRSDLADLTASASSVVTTSVSEGFGFSFLLPWTVGKVLWGRRLPDICPDFEERGVRLDHLYDRLWVPLSWLDEAAFSSRWKRTVRKQASRFGYELSSAAVEGGWGALTAGGRIDFGLLDEMEQQRVLKGLKNDPGRKGALSAHNGWMKNRSRFLHDRERIEANREAVRAAFPPKRLGDGLAAVYRRVSAAPVRHSIDKKRLWSAFFRLDAFSLLQWGDYRGWEEPEGGGRFPVPVPTGLEPRGSLPRMPSAVLFDLYGTLFVSASGDVGDLERRSRSAPEIARLLADFGMEESPSSLLDRFLDAIRFHHRKAREEGCRHPEVEIDRIWREVLGLSDPNAARRFAERFEEAVNPTAPMPHLEAVLQACRTRALRMGIVSNAQFFTLPLFGKFLGRSVEELGFDPELVLPSYRFGVAKPAGRLFRTAAERLRKTGVEAAKALFVGNDIRNDILPAKQAGFMTALFAGDRRSLRLRKDDPGCAQAAPDLVVTDLRQLLDHLPPEAAGR